jgi:hypothetical protein
MLRILLIGLTMIALLVVAERAAGGEIHPGSPQAAIAAELMKREANAWRFYKEKNTAALIAMTPDDFADLYSGGEVVNRARWLADMKGVDVDRQKLSGWHTFSLADDAILFTYDGQAWGRVHGRQVYNHAAVTSVWAKRSGRWLNVFYGETALDPDSVICSGYKAHEKKC